MRIARKKRKRFKRREARKANQDESLLKNSGSSGHGQGRSKL
jgi:hypothetical protein